jgi:hypothetical protein
MRSLREVNWKVSNRTKTQKVKLDVFPTGICGCGQREGENAELYKLMKEVKRDFPAVTVNIAEYGTKIDEAFEKLNAILEKSGKKKLVKLGLGAQVFRSVIPLVAINGKIASVTEVPKKKDLYAKIKAAM